MKGSRLTDAEVCPILNPIKLNSSYKSNSNLVASVSLQDTGLEAILSSQFFWTRNFNQISKLLNQKISG
jgi:hypothetical protein